MNRPNLAELYERIGRLKSAITAERAEASRVAQDIINYVESILPIWIDDSDPSAQTQWIPVRVVNTLKAVFELGEKGLHEDAAALVRIMVDHLITFAWLLADEKAPARINAWKNENLRLMEAQRLAAQSLGDFSLPVLPQPLHTSVEWTSIEQAARECDRFWPQYLEPLFRAGTPNSFSGLYAEVFRRTSSYVHPSALQCGLGFFLVPMERKESERAIGPSSATLPGTYCDAVVVALLTTWILVARFRPNDVQKVLPFFDRVVSLVMKLKAST